VIHEIVDAFRYNRTMGELSVRAQLAIATGMIAWTIGWVSLLITLIVR
jgi:hypothetical protein